jgi:diguanylate cyclase (GGDEF)-like protein
VSEERFRELADTLERRIADRTAGFEAANVLLQWEIEERHRAEAQLQQANALLKEALAGQARHTAVLAQLNQLSTFMQSCRSEVEAYAVVARFAPNLFNAPSGAVFALNAARGVVEAAAVWGDMPADEQTFAPGECWALRRTRLYPENETEAVISCPHMRSEGARRHACVPLSPNGEPLGLLHLRGRPIPLDANERALVTTVSERIAVTVASIKLRENLVRQSLRDALTGLFNRRYLEEFLALEERRGLRTGASIGMVMIDLDRFKAVNDTYGHDAGDEVLRRVAAVLQEHTRSGDIPCRYGGEEFLLVLPGASLEVTRERAEQLRARLAAQRIIFRGNPIGTVTASLGVAAFPTSGTPIAGALAAADRALYLAKQNGRDRVECEGYREVA